MPTAALATSCLRDLKRVAERKELAEARQSEKKGRAMR